MFVKKFEAASVEEALELVKGEFGPNALILSSAKKPTGWLQKTTFEVTAAASDSQEPKAAGLDEETLSRIFPHRKTQHGTHAIDDMRSIRKTSLSRYQDLSRIDHALERLVEEGWKRIGFSDTSSKGLTRTLFTEYSKEDLTHPSFLDRARINVLSSRLRTLSVERMGHPRGHASIVFIGPAGSGKTSFLVKLALHLKKLKRPVVIRSFDNRKILGRKEIATYAGLIAVPFEKANPGTAPHIELIDTPALIAGDRLADEMQVLLEQSPAVLVLDASVRTSQCLRILKELPRKPLALALTRSELAEDKGELFELMSASDLPLLGASFSQSFREEIRFFEIKGLAAFILSKDFGKGFYHA